MRSSLFLIISGLLLLLSAYRLGGEAFVLQLYDTYYVVSWQTVIGIIGLIGVLGGTASLVMDRMTTRRL